MGSLLQRSFAERWNGSSWSLQRILTPKGSQLVAVSCPSTRDCVAVGRVRSPLSTYPLAERWNGSKWSLEPAPHSGPGMLDAVSCTSPGACTAVGASYNPAGGTQGPLASVGTDRRGRSRGSQIRLPRTAMRFRPCRAQPLASVSRVGRQARASRWSIAGMATLGRSSRPRGFSAATTSSPESPAGRRRPVRRSEGTSTAEGRPHSANWLAGLATTPSSSAPIPRTASSWAYRARPRLPARRSKSRTRQRAQSSRSGTG